MAVRLFIGNLPYGATEAELRAHFGQIGEPSQVVMPVDRETGRPRGFAFVEFADRAVAEEVIRKFDQQVFKGRPLAVSEARAREDRGPGGPRPGGGGFAPRPPGGGFAGGGGFGGPRPGGFGAPRPGGEAPGGATGGRERNFGPPAPPKGKGRGKKQGSYDQKPKGPIKVKPSGRIYAVDDMEDEVAADFDDFATAAEDDDVKDDVTAEVNEGVTEDAKADEDDES